MNFKQSFSTSAAVLVASLAIPAHAAPGGSDDFWKNLSLGLAVISSTKPEIVSATVENGIVRVTEKRSMRAVPWLQTGLVSDRDFLGGKLGMFLGAEVLSGDKLINAIGIGPMIQLKRGNSEEGKKPINLGIGVQWSTMQVLGNGFEEDKPKPAGTEAVRFKKITKPGIVINFSMDL
jgi:hypothetical protein